jgi:hypothetical protein
LAKRHRSALRGYDDDARSAGHETAALAAPANSMTLWPSTASEPGISHALGAPRGPPRPALRGYSDGRLHRTRRNQRTARRNSTLRRAALRSSETLHPIYARLGALGGADPPSADITPIVGGGGAGQLEDSSWPLYAI